jgi:ATP-binding cassette subfamily B protein
MSERPSSGRGRRPAETNEPPKSWRERLQDVRTAYNNIPGAFRLVWAADKGSTIVMAVLTLISAALPASQAWVGKLIIDSVIGSINSGVGPQAGLQATLPFLGLEFGLLLTSAVIAQLRRLAEHVLNARLGHHINSAVIRKALALDLQYFEDASFYDKLQNARREADFRALGIINGSFLVVH